MPTLKNKGKKQKPTVTHARRQSFDDAAQQQSPPPPLPPLTTNDDFMQRPPTGETESQGRQTYRKPPTPGQPGLFILLIQMIHCLILLPF